MRRRQQAVVLAVVGVFAAAGALALLDPGAPSETDQARSAAGAHQIQTTLGPRRPAPAPIVRYSAGRGARGAAIVRRAGRTGPRPVVVFLHGWGLTRASDYRGWIRHLAATGNTVVVPRYQRDEGDDPGLVRERMLAGVRRALRTAPVAEGSLVVAGHSAGAALAADYAAVAESAGLPRPAAVFAVYPGRAILGFPGGIPEADLGRIPGDTRLVALAGAQDAVVGTQPAARLVARASGIPRDRRRLVTVSDPRVTDHFAPTRSDPAARAAFWRRLDRLIVRARAG